MRNNTGFLYFSNKRTRHAAVQIDTLGDTPNPRYQRLFMRILEKITFFYISMFIESNGELVLRMKRILEINKRVIII